MNELKTLLRSIPSLIVAVFFIATISMNLLANKSINLPVSWLALDCGIIVSWIIFLCMDIVTRQFGPRAATLLSVAAIAVNLAMCFIFFIGSRIPGTWGESYVDGAEIIINTALDHTFGGTWFVLLGSSIAFFVSALVNNFSNWYIGVLLRRSEERRSRVTDTFLNFACRSWVSTALGQFVDNITFAFIVSRTFFGWTTLQCFTCAVTGAVVELLCEMIFSPVGYRICQRWQKENVGAAYLEQYAM
ncbi:MAG: VUT family protein [Mogibacterium sp.]|nr:VUT family protein [Mogibacterium sp.]